MGGKEDTKTGEGHESGFKSPWNVLCHGEKGLKDVGKVNTEKCAVVHGSLLNYSPLLMFSGLSPVKCLLFFLPFPTYHRPVCGH